MVHPVAVQVIHSNKVDVRGWDNFGFYHALPEGVHKTAKITDAFLMSDGSVKSIKEMDVALAVECLVFAGKTGRRYENEGYEVEY